MRQTLGCRDIHPLELPVGTDNIPPPPDAVGALAAGGGANMGSSRREDAVARQLSLVDAVRRRAAGAQIHGAHGGEVDHNSNN